MALDVPSHLLENSDTSDNQQKEHKRKLSEAEQQLQLAAEQLAEAERQRKLVEAQRQEEKQKHQLDQASAAAELEGELSDALDREIGDYYALVIGNNDYEHLRIWDLPW